VVVPEAGPVTARASVCVFGFPVGGPAFLSASVARMEAPPRARPVLVLREEDDAEAGALQMQMVAAPVRNTNPLYARPGSDAAV
jgi:hypothetical protein